MSLCGRVRAAARSRPPSYWLARPNNRYFAANCCPRQGRRKKAQQRRPLCEKGLELLYLLAMKLQHLHEERVQF